MCAELSPTETTPVTIASPEWFRSPAAPISLMKSRNFEFLRERHRELADLGGFAETYVHSDPTSCLVKLRTFAEFLVEALFSHHRLELTYQSNLNDLLADHSFKSITPPVVQDKLHLTLKVSGKDLPINLIKHSGMCFSPDKWRTYLQRQAPELMRLVADPGHLLPATANL
jgi:hypothetical protein